MIEVCTIACETLAESERFPEDWIMKHRWKKGSKESSTLPTGEKIIHLTVGGRTSAVVPSLQKKTGAVAGDVSANQKNGSDEDQDDGEEKKPKKARGGSKANGAVKEEQEPVKPTKRGRRSTKMGKAEEEEVEAPKSKKVKASSAVKSEKPAAQGRRRSARNSTG